MPKMSTRDRPRPLGGLDQIRRPRCPAGRWIRTIAPRSRHRASGSTTSIQVSRSPAVNALEQNVIAALVPHPSRLLPDHRALGQRPDVEHLDNTNAARTRDSSMARTARRTVSLSGDRDSELPTHRTASNECGRSPAGRRTGPPSGADRTRPARRGIARSCPG